MFASLLSPCCLSSLSSPSSTPPCLFILLSLYLSFLLLCICFLSLPSSLFSSISLLPSFPPFLFISPPIHSLSLCSLIIYRLSFLSPSLSLSSLFISPLSVLTYSLFFSSLFIYLLSHFLSLFQSTYVSFISFIRVFSIYLSSLFFHFHSNYLIMVYLPPSLLLFFLFSLTTCLSLPSLFILSFLISRLLLLPSFVYLVSRIFVLFLFPYSLSLFLILIPYCIPLPSLLTRLLSIILTCLQNFFFYLFTFLNPSCLYFWPLFLSSSFFLVNQSLILFISLSSFLLLLIFSRFHFTSQPIYLLVRFLFFLLSSCA